MVGGAIGGGLGTQTTDRVKRINRAEQDQEMQREGGILFSNSSSNITVDRRRMTMIAVVAGGFFFEELARNDG